MRVPFSMFSVSSATFITRTRLVKQIIFPGKPVLKIILPGKGGGIGGGGRRLLPYMAYTAMYRWTGYGFCPLCPKQGI